MVEISPDSLEPAVAEIRKHYEAASDEVLKTVYQTVLHRIDVMNYSISIDIKAPRLTPALCETLGSVKDETYKPFVVGGVDAAIFNNDMLSVIGYEIDSDFEEMHAYYEKVGNRRAACITAARLYRYASVDKIDAAIRQYEDLQEAGELAIVRYDKFAYDAKAERLAYIREALSKWGRWSRMDYLRNEEQRLTNPQYSVAYIQPAGDLAAAVAAGEADGNTQPVVADDEGLPCQCKWRFRCVAQLSEGLRRTEAVYR